MLAGPRKRPATARARALIGHIACVEFLIPGSEVARRLNIDRSAVSRATRRVGEDPELSGASAKIVEQIRRKD
jgi:predicted regulator of amino acid metabolism with ACT domain